MQRQTSLRPTEPSATSAVCLESLDEMSAGLIDDGGRPSRRSSDVSDDEKAIPARPDGLTQPADTRFYGVINDCIEMVVCERFGKMKWNEVKRRAGMQDTADGSFAFNQKYSYIMTLQLLEAITDILGITTEQALETAGEGFIELWCVKNHYLGMLRSQGRDMRELLRNMDRMHAYMKKSNLPGMSPPCFQVEESSEWEGFILHYWSFREGLAPLAKGIIRAAGRMLFQKEFKMEVQDASQESGNYYTKFWVTTEEDPNARRDSRETIPIPMAQVLHQGLALGSTSSAQDDSSMHRSPSQKSLSIASFLGLSGTAHLEKVKRATSESGKFSPMRSPFSRRTSQSCGDLCSTPTSKTGKRKSVAGSEVGAMVFMLRESVSRITTMEDVQNFHKGFTVKRLCTLLEMKGADPVLALKALFRPPIETMRRCPNAGYPPSNFAVCEYPSVIMHRDVTSRLTLEDGTKPVDWMHPPLADQKEREGILGFGAAKEMQQITIKACFLENIVSLRVLKAIAMSSNNSLYESAECQAIILAAWNKVHFRYVFDILLEVLLVCVLFQWQRTEDIFVRGYPVLVASVLKDLAEEVWGLAVHVEHGWFWEYISSARLGGWSRIVLLTLFLTMNALHAPLEGQREIYAMVVLIRWGRLLYMLRAFDSFGPKILPILYMIKSIGPFVVVLCFYVAAFSHALWALSHKSLAQVMPICYRLGILMDFDLDRSTGDPNNAILEGGDMDAHLYGWFYVCSAVLAIFMMNVVIGVLGASYDLEQERAAFSFLASRAHICYEYIPRQRSSSQPLKLYNVLRAVNHTAQDSQWRCLLYMAATSPVYLLYCFERAFVREWRVFDHHGDDSKDHHAPFLWFCQVKGAEVQEEESAAKTARIKQQAAKSNDALSARLDTMDTALGQMSQALAGLAKEVKKANKQSRTRPAGLRRLSETSSEQSSRIDTSRPPSCPDGGLARLPPDIEATPSARPLPPRPDGAFPPDDKLFYGVINALIEDVVCQQFGRPKWHALKRAAGLEEIQDGDFLPTQQYSLDLTYQILTACPEVLQISVDQALEAVGEGFIDLWCVKYDHIDLLRSQGTNMRAFLRNIDKIHKFLKQEKMPGMAPPSFSVEDSQDGHGFILHYWSFRAGLASLVVGIVRAAARMLFEQDCTIHVIESLEGDGHYYTKFRLFGADVPDTPSPVHSLGETPRAEVAQVIKCPFSGVAISGSIK